MSIVEFLKVWHDTLIERASALRFDKSNPAELNLIALYGSILELTGCILVLLDNRGRSGIPSIFRAFLEAYIELRNLADNYEYVNHMNASQIDQWLKVLREAQNAQNPYLGGMAEAVNLDEEIERKTAELNALKENGFAPLNVFQRFEKADMVEEYRSLYNFLSCDAHCNVRALIARHIEFLEDDINVVYYKDEPVDTFIATLDTTAGLLYDASKKIHEALDSEHSEGLEKMSNELETIRATYSA